jgi:hypothetical protein
VRFRLLRPLCAIPCPRVIGQSMLENLLFAASMIIPNEQPAVASARIVATAGRIPAAWEPFRDCVVNRESTATRERRTPSVAPKGSTSSSTIRGVAVPDGTCTRGCVTPGCHGRRPAGSSPASTRRRSSDGARSTRTRRSRSSSSSLGAGGTGRAATAATPSSPRKGLDCGSPLPQQQPGGTTPK